MWTAVAQSTALENLTGLGTRSYVNGTCRALIVAPRKAECPLELTEAEYDAKAADPDVSLPARPHVAPGLKEARQ